MATILILLSGACYVTAVFILAQIFLVVDTQWALGYDIFFFWLHTGIGFLWSALLVIFIFEHIIAKKNFLKKLNWQLVSGTIQIATIFSVMLSGLLLFLYANESSQLLQKIHRYSSFLLIASSVLHIPRLKKAEFWRIILGKTSF